MTFIALWIHKQFNGLSGVGVVVQCINHSPITQEPRVRFQVATMQHHKQLKKWPIKAALMCASKAAPPSGHS